MIRYFAVPLLVLSCGSALAANKCVINGRVEYMDTACPAEAKSSVVRTDRANSVDTSHGYALDKAAGRRLDCDEAKETHRHNPSREQRAVVAQACGPMSAQERAQLRAQEDAAAMRASKEANDRMLKSLDRQYKAQQRAIRP